MLSRDQLKLHGAALAGIHSITTRHLKEKLLLRLKENEKILAETCDLLISAVKADFRIAPAGEWLLDNFYLIKEQINTAKKHLPAGYSRELPRLNSGPSTGLPRVYDIALETVMSGDGQIDIRTLSSFVEAYQQIAILKIGELWAIPIMLRLALIENLRRVGEQVAAERLDRNLASSWADQMATIAEKDPKNLIMVVADMAHSNPTLSSSFVAELVRRLQGQGVVLALPLTWIEQSLLEAGLTIEQQVQAETKQQAANQVSVSNSIASIRMLGAIDWREFVEAQSNVEQILSEDPAKIYSGMDFATRDQYRHIVERTAKNSSMPEEKVARLAIDLARAASVSDAGDKRSLHVGFYLVGKGLPKLEALARTRLPSVEALLRMSSRFPLILYLGSIAIITLVLSWNILARAGLDGAHGFVLVLAGMVAAICTSHLAVSLVNWLVTMLVSPHALPRMDFSKGIPAEFRTLVVIPTMLTSAANIEHLIEALEVRFLANRDEKLHFGLLTDLVDSKEQNLAVDSALESLARQKIEELNEKYRGASANTFFLFHRSRQWNPQEKVWMGYERKRGKLADLNMFLRGGAKDKFSLVVGNTLVLAKVKYVITLDTDTILPRDSARQFIAAMAHPLNRPFYDQVKQRVTDGYTILQPRVAVSLPNTMHSWYSGLYGSDAGIDPYTRVVSDIYQDVFGEGSFTGKGIYDVDSFELALHSRFPENRILSHDLIEGCYVRSGFLSDVMLYEEYPGSYSADVSRWHRWVRGDWQIASWLRSTVPVFGGKTEKNPLSWLSQWKVLDNLRRSFVAMAFTILLILSWTTLTPAWLWTLLTIGILIAQSFVASIVEMYRRPRDVRFGRHMLSSLRSAWLSFTKTAFTVICLPFEGFLNFDAIIRTLWRLLVSRKPMLEWNPSGNTSGNRSLSASIRAMWIAPCTGLAVFALLENSRPSALVYAWPILLLWVFSPALMWWVSQPLPRLQSRLNSGQVTFLRKVARKTWAFFEAVVGVDDNWLPPDNFQENRPVLVAHRTSPTNMGIALLANLSAYDFGYITAGKFMERTQNALKTMDSMERHRGHFYNWYDTQSLQPLPPLYISSVDSGNLAAYLLTLRSGLQTFPGLKIVNPRLFEGLSDTLAIFMEAFGNDHGKAVAGFNDELKGAISSPPVTLSASWQCLKKLGSAAEKLVLYMAPEAESEAKWWAMVMAGQCRDAFDELQFLAPWLTMVIESGKLNEFRSIDSIPTLAELAKLDQTQLPVICQLQTSCTQPSEQEWLSKFTDLVVEGGKRARARIATVEALISQSGRFMHMEYDFLYDKACRLLAIGYNVSEHRLDSSLYDLLASEARLATFMAVAQGQLPQESWFALGRLLSNAGNDPVLLSWNGSMFEYLMPLLIMPTYDNTLLDNTYRAVVEAQINFGRECGLPWGVSESGFNMVDAHINYQYRAFGVPGLGLKRGLAEDLVVAPYASAMALMVSPRAACENLQRLDKMGFSGRFGLYEAIDYTPARQIRGKSGVIISSFMAHHQGMSLLSLAYALLNRPMQKRFESNPCVQATLLLLQERVPKDTAFYSHATEIDLRLNPDTSETQVRIFNTPDTTIPEVQLLSNRRYHVMVTNSGGGYSRWQDFAVTRWREDTTRDNWGTFCYIRDLATQEFWSNAYQPTLKKPDLYEVIFSEGRAEFRRRDREIELHTEIVVSPEDDIELRRIVITNRSRRRREIEMTSYSEIVLAPPATDELHPAFSNLFVQTEIIRESRAILCSRRPRSSNEPVLWMFHLLAVHGVHHGEVSYETDRMRFIGRGNTVAEPRALKESAALSGSEGSVLDPIVAIRRRITLDPGQSAKIDMVSGVGGTREAALNLVEKYQDRRIADRVFELAWTHNQVNLQQLNISEADAQLYGRLAGSIIFANSLLRADPGVIARNSRMQSNLWGYSISGDLPIVLLQVKDPENIGLVKQMVQAHTYWRSKGLVVDLFIWNENPAGYRQILHDQIIGLIAAGIEANLMDRSGGIFLRLLEQIPVDDRILFQTVARAIISDNCGDLADQLYPRGVIETIVPDLKLTRTPFPLARLAAPLPRNDLNFFNGLGGFTPDGKEYVITTSPDQVTPAPWVNVLANPHFGTVISESGLAYTWGVNAHEFRLTPWNNDPVCDASGEAFYLRDEERGHFWSPMPLPRRGMTPYTTRHGFGYSVFEHTEFGIRSEVWVYVALNSSVKFTLLKIRNESGQNRKLSVTGYVEWVLGDLRRKTSSQIITAVDQASGVLLARNSYNTEFSSRAAFFDVDETSRTFTGDRAEFIGRNRTLKNPAAMARARLSNKAGAALDPCAAIQVPFELANGQEREITFRLGTGEDYAATVDLARCFRGAVSANREREAVWNYWAHTLGAVQVETPDMALNLMANGWLLYQTMACRLWARSGFYQSGGAFGFRDQLQDVMALVHTQPALVREHLLLCASRQFREGDVQHWWHPPLGRGVRTLCSDDFLWLVMATCRYVRSTGDTGVLDEPVDFLEGRPVGAEEDSYYDLPTPAGSVASLYTHCVRAVIKGINYGEHGLPLMGSGDWNDGMNLVGIKGKGESVWLAFFMHDVLMQFRNIALQTLDHAFADRCLQEAETLSENIEKNGWDGQWYRRAYFDDGSALGSSANDECSIDSIAQSWSVLSGAGDLQHAKMAMQALNEQLVDREHSLVKLLHPPLDKTALNPGYIKGYVPGVRENGGQYTHGAIWATMAFAASEDRARAWELFSMINPVNHARTAKEVSIYKVEPYVVAADVYGLAPHTGRGGWTWYSGSAAWMYRLILESLLGLRLEGNQLFFAPCLPAKDWDSCKIHYRYRETVYHITIQQVFVANDGKNAVVGSQNALQQSLTLVDDRQEHNVAIKIPSAR